jgi:hypothetical protein
VEKGASMKLRALGVLATLFVALVNSPAAQSSTGPSAQVENIATVVIGGTGGLVDFQVDVRNCPAGDPITLIDWTADQPSRVETAAAAPPVEYGPSTGTTMNLTVSAFGNFVAGESWVGSGSIMCGAVLIPLVGSGQTHSVHGV